jgi:C-terminal processing protease CtpA/Prc
LATAGYSTGLVGSASSGAFAGKAWGVHVFSPAQYPYHDGVWTGPLIVLVDQETWSAAEEFAAVLQDNKAAVILGARTGGAGCGHTNGGTPTTLKNSGAVLELPDCVRFRADGSNEVRGIIPDEVVALRADDGLQLRARLILEKLPAAIAGARSIHSRTGG